MDVNAAAMTLRRIRPLPLPDIVTPDLGPRPVVEWVKPNDLWVDSTYQRETTKSTMRLVKKVVAEFAWSRIKLPIVVRADGLLHVIDGQHTAIAAATLHIEAIPVLVVMLDTVAARADAFVAHNTDRVKVGSIEVFRAMVAAGNEDAREVEGVMARAGVVLRHNTNLTVPRVGDTMAIGLIRRLVKNRGVMRARQVLETLVEAKLAPIGGNHIHAVEHIVCVTHKRIDIKDLARIIRADGEEGVLAASTEAKRLKLPVWKVMSERWRSRIGDVGRAA